jgi:hypothetical protein
LEDVENYVKKIGVRGWIKIAKDRDAWKLTLKEAKVLHGSRASGEEVSVIVRK